MIKLTRLDGKQFFVNADLIRYVEKQPDTYVTLTTGDRLIVNESMEEVIDRAVRYQQTKHMVPSGWAQRHTTHSTHQNTSAIDPTQTL